MEKESLNDKIMDFMNKNINLIVIAVLIFALILRLKYLTINQAVWYDEAEYLSVAKSWAFNITSYQLHFVRPPLLPLILSILYKIGGTELTFRILMVLFSITGVIFTYLAGKELFDKRIALIATFIMSFFYLNLFYTVRLLTDLPSTTFWLISIWLFWKGYIKSESNIYLWFFGLSSLLGVLMKFPFGLLFIIILIYLLITEKLQFLRRKDLWKASMIFIIGMIPYSIWYYQAYNKIPILGAADFYTPAIYLKGYLQILPIVLQSPIPGVASIFPSLGNLFLVLFIIGLLVIIYNLILGYDLVSSNNDLKKLLFLLLWIIIPFAYFVLYAGQAPEDRYLFYIYPAIFYLIGYSFIRVYPSIKKIFSYFGKSIPVVGIGIKKYSSLLSILFLSVILLSICFTQLEYANRLIEFKSDSYIQFKYAGQWIKDNSNSEDKIIAAGVPQLTYYSEREIIQWPSKEEFDVLIKDPKVKYLILSRLEGSPEWSYSWPEENKDKTIPVQAYLDPEKRPMLIIYKLIDR